MRSLLGKRSFLMLLLLSVVCVGINTTPVTVFAQQPTSGAQQATSTPPLPLDAPPGCVEGYALPWWLSSVSCFLNAVTAVVGGLILGLFGLVLGIVGTFFSFAITYTIVQFGGTGGVYELVREGVEAAWTTFRDLANIVIVGSLVFVAIATILGSLNFGVRKFLARIIIAAVLINFSLFFTKFAIDASHIVARAFYVPIEAMAGRGTDQNISTGTLNPDGVAGAFMNTLGIARVLDAPEVVLEIAKRSDAFTIVTAYTILTSLVFLGAAVVLAYGGYLLAVRIVILIFLILTSALAFAARAVPGLEKQWERWFNELTKNLLFAPTLMMFLWATLTVANGMTGRDGNIANLITNPTEGSSMVAIFNYAIILGLLYLSIELAKSMSVRGAKQLPGLKDSMMKVGAGALPAWAAGNNAVRYMRSRYAANKIESGSIQQQMASGDKKVAEAASRRLNRLQMRADGNFDRFKLKDRAILGGITPLVTGAQKLSAVKTVLAEGAGKKGVAGARADAEKESVKAVEAAAKQVAPQKGEKEQFVQKEAERRVIETSDDTALKEARRALEREKQRHEEAQRGYKELSQKNDRTQEEEVQMQDMRKAADTIERAYRETQRHVSDAEERVIKESADQLKTFQTAVAEEVAMGKKGLESMKVDDPRYAASRYVLEQHQNWDERQSNARENAIANITNGDALAAVTLRGKLKEQTKQKEEDKQLKRILKEMRAEDDDGEKKGGDDSAPKPEKTA